MIANYFKPQEGLMLNSSNLKRVLATDFEFLEVSNWTAVILVSAESLIRPVFKSLSIS